MRPLIEVEEAVRRLELIFPKGGFDTTLSGDLAGFAVASLIYIDAVAPQGEEPGVWARPMTVMWQQEDILTELVSDEARHSWREAEAKSRKKVEELLRSWDRQYSPRYDVNSRETLRDEIFKAWRDMGVIRERQGLPTTSSKPRWALESHFADLFDPEISEPELMLLIEEWSNKYLSPGHRLKSSRAHQMAAKDFEVRLTLPEGEIRTLESGASSLILKGVIEEWAPRKLVDPVVLTISEPGDKVYMNDRERLRQLGLSIDVSNLLPDALLADVGVDPVVFWIVEAVSTDGPITESRKRELLAWAEEQRIPPADCAFLTAFASRNAAPAKRRLKDLAAGTYAWYFDEPNFELFWDDIESSADDPGTISRGID